MPIFGAAAIQSLPLLFCLANSEESIFQTSNFNFQNKCQSFLLSELESKHQNIELTNKAPPETAAYKKLLLRLSL
jgi:hypothetical protein